MDRSLTINNRAASKAKAQRDVTPRPTRSVLVAKRDLVKDEFLVSTIAIIEKATNEGDRAAFAGVKAMLVDCTRWKVAATAFRTVHVPALCWAFAFKTGIVAADIACGVVQMRRARYVL